MLGGGVRSWDPQNLSSDTLIIMEFGTGNKSGNLSLSAKF